jgi:PilZ domain-containing protein
MTLSSMVVSRDWQEISVLECILGGLHIAVDVEAHPDRAREKLSKSKVDAMIVDCDLDGAADFVRELQNGLVNKSMPVVVLRGSRDHNSARIQPASFEFQKPISVEQAVHTLSAARNMILDGRLRYHRQALDVPISLSCGSHKRVAASLLNLSQGGVGIRAHRTLAATGPLKVSFALPGTKLSLNFQGELAWTDNQGNAGIRFLKMDCEMKRNLQLWLEQQYLTD